MHSRLRQSLSPDDYTTPSLPQKSPARKSTRSQSSPSSSTRTRSTSSTVYRSPSSSPPATSQPNRGMGLTATYQVAATARSKLGSEASQPDHNLRRLVGHANLLDELMLKLADAERKQERWFSSTVRSEEGQERRIRWADTIVEDPDENAVDEDEDDEHNNHSSSEVEDSESDSDSDTDPSTYDEDAEEFLARAPLIRLPSPPVRILSRPVSRDGKDEQVVCSAHGVHAEDGNSSGDGEEHIYADDEDDAEHALVRVYSHPPELVHDDEDAASEEDEAAAVASMPPSPPQPVLRYQQPDAKKTPSFAGQTKADAPFYAGAQCPMIQAF